jgi:hypothetical protein
LNFANIANSAAVVFARQPLARVEGRHEDGQYLFDDQEQAAKE